MPATIMNTRSPLVLLFTLLTLLVNTLNVEAQQYTTTLPWIDGDTIIVSQSTNAAGQTLAIQTLSTIILTTTGLTATTPTGLLTTTSTTTPLVATTTSSTTPLVLTTSSTTPLVLTTSSVPTTTSTTTPAVLTTAVADETTSTRRRQSTSIPIVATPTVPSGEVVPVPAGTIMDYSEYQASINQAASTGEVNPAMNGGSNGAVEGRGVVGMSVLGAVGLALVAMVGL